MTTPTHPHRWQERRRQLLGLLAGLGVLGLARPLLAARAAAPAPSRPALSLHEAEFYRPEDPASGT
jgi:hypothetical protein